MNMYNVEEQAKAIQELRKGIISKAAALCKKNLEHQMELGTNEPLYTIETNIGCHYFLDLRIYDIKAEETILSETIYTHDYFNSSRCSLERIEENAAIIAKEINNAKETIYKYMKLNLKEIGK